MFENIDGRATGRSQGVVLKPWVRKLFDSDEWWSALEHSHRAMFKEGYLYAGNLGGNRAYLDACVLATREAGWEVSLVNPAYIGNGTLAQGLFAVFVRRTSLSEDCSPKAPQSI